MTDLTQNNRIVYISCPYTVSKTFTKSMLNIGFQCYTRYTCRQNNKENDKYFLCSMGPFVLDFVHYWQIPNMIWNRSMVYKHTAIRNFVKTSDKLFLPVHNVLNSWYNFFQLFIISPWQNLSWPPKYKKKFCRGHTLVSGVENK